MLRTSVSIEYRDGLTASMIASAMAARTSPAVAGRDRPRHPRRGRPETPPLQSQSSLTPATRSLKGSLQVLLTPTATLRA